VNSAYTEIIGEASYRAAIDSVIENSDREIAIFDRDLIAMRLDEPARLNRLKAFLERGADQRLRIVVHDPIPLTHKTPRLAQLFVRCKAWVEVRQSPETLRQLCDSHVIGDRNNGLRRFHANHPRSALIAGDADYLNPWLKRFNELWDLSEAQTLGITTGL